MRGRARSARRACLLAAPRPSPARTLDANLSPRPLPWRSPGAGRRAALAVRAAASAVERAPAAPEPRCDAEGARRAREALCPRPAAFVGDVDLALRDPARHVATARAEDRRRCARACRARPRDDRHRSDSYPTLVLDAKSYPKLAAACGVRRKVVPPAEVPKPRHKRGRTRGRTRSSRSTSRSSTKAVRRNRSANPAAKTWLARPKSTWSPKKDPHFPAIVQALKKAGLIAAWFDPAEP